MKEELKSKSFLSQLQQKERNFYVVLKEYTFLVSHLLGGLYYFPLLFPLESKYNFIHSSPS